MVSLFKLGNTFYKVSCSSTIGMRNLIEVTVCHLTSAQAFTNIKVYARYLSYHYCLSIWVINPNWTWTQLSLLECIYVFEQFELPSHGQSLCCLIAFPRMTFSLGSWEIICVCLCFLTIYKNYNTLTYVMHYLINLSIILHYRSDYFVYELCGSVVILFITTTWVSKQLTAASLETGVSSQVTCSCHILSEFNYRFET